MKLAAPVLSWRRIARQAAAVLGPPEAARLLHVTDIHNSVRGFRFASALAAELAPRLVVDTGDLCGAGGPLEAAILRTLLRIGRPHVLAPGNHDSAATVRVLRRMGAVVLDLPRMETVGGVRVWGFPDPNRSPLGAPAYDSRLCREIARVVRPPDEVDPYVIAVHNSRMVEHPPGGVGLVFCGHRHQPAVERRRGAVFVRCGSTGGGGPFGGPLQAAVVDLGLPEHRPIEVWLLETDGRGMLVRPTLSAGRTG